MKRLVIIITVITLFILVLISSIFIVKEDQYAIVTEFGRVKNTIYESGLYIKLPYPIQAVDYLDKKDKVFSPKPLEVFIPDEQNILKNIIIGYYLIWRIEEPLKFYEILKNTSIAEIRLNNNIRSYIYNLMGQYQINSLFSTNKEDIKINEISEKLTYQTNQDFLKEYGIKIKLVNIKKIILPEQNKKKIFERMVAERERISSKYRAEGEEEAKIIISQTNKEKEILLSQAKLDAERIISKAKAEAAQIYAKAFKKDKEFYKLWLLLQSYNNLFDNNTTFVMSTDNELLKLLEMKSEFFKDDK